MSNLRFRVVDKAFNAEPLEVAAPAQRPDEYFAKYVFNREKMFKYLPSRVFEKLTNAMDNGAALDRDIADRRGRRHAPLGQASWAPRTTRTGSSP